MTTENPDAVEVVDSQKLKNIRALTAAGFALIPCRGKVPVVPKWETAKPGQYKESRLVAGNYGIVLTAEVLVIDIDPRNFEDGKNPVEALMADLGDIIKRTMMVRTGGGGVHIFLRKPADINLPNTVEKYGPGVEFKSAGRQVVGPGSIHPDTGKEYALVAGEPSSLMEAPADFLAALGTVGTVGTVGVAAAAAVAPPGSDSGPEQAAATAAPEFKNDDATQERFALYLEQHAAPSVEGRSGDLNAFKVAAEGRDLGLPPDITLSLMLAHWNGRCRPPWDPKELEEKVAHAYKYANSPIGAKHPENNFTPISAATSDDKEKPEGEWQLTSQGAVRKTFVNLLNYLRSSQHSLAQVFGYNEFSCSVEFMNPAPWHKGIMPAYKGISDGDLKLLKGYLSQHCRFETSVATIDEAVVVVAYENRFHPVREYLSGLVWDKTPRLDFWLRDFCGAADDDYTRAVSRKVLCAAVARVFKPGVKFDYVLVLEGAQDIGKSTVCEVLGGEWYDDFTVDPHSPDTIQRMQGKWVLEMAELESVRRSDVDALKAFITRKVDVARLAYGRLPVHAPRQGIFIATKNPAADGAYLKDDTGNRRWWPLPVEPKAGALKLDIKGLRESRNQLFAEAVERVKLGERIDMDTLELKTAAKIVVAKRHAEHEWTERITIWIAGLPVERDFISGREVFIEAMNGIEKQYDRRSSLAIATVLRSLGWHLTVKRFGDQMRKGYKKFDPTLAGGVKV